MGRVSKKSNTLFPEKTLQLRSPADSSLGQVIAYLQNHISGIQKLSAFTLEARFLPFVMDKDDPEFLETAIECAEICEAWGATIRQYVGLSVEPIQVSKIQTRSSSGTKKKKNSPNKSKTDKQKKPSSGESLLDDMGLF